MSDDISPDENIYINEADGLTNDHPSLPVVDPNNEGNAADEDSFDDLPTSIIVTNIHSEVFISEDLKSDMEDLFRSFSEDIRFCWLKSFRRLRVDFKDAVSAANARIKLHQFPFGTNSIINCYFAQPVTPISARNLQLPPLTKQWLISPPASPPAGWEPRAEGEPIINHDLLMALANLTPGESRELHPPTESQPAIVVHTAIIADGIDVSKQKILQTKCPERS